MRVLTVRAGLAGKDASTLGRAMLSDVRFSEVRRYVESHGWILVRIRGSHHVFRRPNGQTFAVPVHHGSVKYVYYRKVKKIIEEEGS